MPDEPFAVMSCPGCGLVPVALAAFEVHVGAGTTLFTYPCPGCGNVGSGGGEAFIRTLLASGVPRRGLRCIGPEAADVEEQVADLRVWLQHDPVW
jgi:hypothetical protein